MADQHYIHQRKGAWLRILTSIVALIIFAVAFLLACTNDSGGFLPNLGRWLAGALLLAGNLLVLVLNVLYWLMYGAKKELRMIIAIQGVVALCTVVKLTGWA
ncbi:hypothetical protein AWB74_07952 [Caballeronia arvi]|uniref:Uncharacterized protein n=1 Tax=Caballeronia arvi TaxID=1777135 RepID=A0A158L118_9BURK|nr:hypothetical protein [Caballeronia arvi]SAL87052.1 hypothetical protein AWB74_07952 [Caballeronia arvi]